MRAAEESLECKESLVLVLVFVASCLIGLVLKVQAEDGNLVEPFKASYRVDRAGISVGEAELQLEYQNTDHYRMRSSLRLSGLVSLFFADSVDEEVHGELIGGSPRPLTYRSQRSGDKARTVSLGFEWARAEVAATKNGEETILALKPDTVDPLSLHLLVLLDLRTGSGAAEYSVISSDRLKSYRMRRLGSARMKTAMGEFETLIVSRQRQDSKKVTTYWHAPELGYLPVQISEANDGEEIARLTIKTLAR